MAIAEIPIRIEWTYGHGAPGANVWHARTDAAAPGGDFDDQLGWIQGFYDDIKAVLGPGVTVNFDGEIRGVGADTGHMWSATPWTVNSTGTGDAMSPALAMLVSWRTEGVGRRGRGRTFVGPLAQGVMDGDGTPDANAVSIVLGAAAALIESSDTATNGAVGIYSRVDNVVRDVVSAGVPKDFAVLRTRRD